MKQNLLTRFGTSLIILAVFILIFITSGVPVLFEITVSALIVFCIWEAIRGTGYGERKMIMVSSMVYGALVPIIFSIKQFIEPSWSAYYGMIVLSFVYMIAIFLIMMANFDKVKFDNCATIMFMSVLISGFLTNILYIRKIEEHGFFYMVLAIVCGAWITDIFAYLVGVLIGKHRFAPKVSPKKTIEGSLGGLVFSVVFFVLFCWIYQQFKEVEIRWHLVILYAVICSLVGQIGDLSFSLIKRSYDIKDFGRILPGHGGILDRLDSLIFIAPTFYLLLKIEEIIV